MSGAIRRCDSVFLEREHVFRSSFRTRLESAMDSRNVSRKQLAYLTGIHPNTIASYLTGNSVPDAVRLRRIAYCLDVSADDLLGL